MKYVLFFILAFILGCKQPERKVEHKSVISKSDSLEAIRKAKRAASEKQWYQDSLKDESIVSDVISYIKTRKLTKINTELKIWKDTTVSAHLHMGNLFSSGIKHIVIRSHVGWKIIIYVYRLDNFKRELRDDWSDLTYMGDFIKDINGDGVNDFVINWYPSSGCCARNNYHVYLYKANDTFTPYFDFINPSFFPGQKIVRGVDYGHPGEVPLYKYRWDGVRLDTIEYIYPADTVKKKFYRVKRYGDEDDPQKRETLKAVPKEYIKLDAYDWFIDY